VGKKLNAQGGSGGLDRKTAIKALMALEGEKGKFLIKKIANYMELFRPQSRAGDRPPEAPLV
jgi:hypothetical protein